jgi:uncharacterized protein YdaU (DUF1376 family)
VNEYRLHIGDYAKHTVHLSNAEDLAYRRALDFYYDTEQPLRPDIPWLTHRLRVGSEELEFVLREFFELRETGYHNKRADAEISKFHAFLEKQKYNGKQGGRPPKGGKEKPKKPRPNPNETQKKPNHLPSTILLPNGNSAETAPASQTLKSQIFGPCLDWLSSASDRTPEKLRSQVGRWCKLYGDAVTVDCIVSAQRESPVDPISWIEKALKSKRDGNENRSKNNRDASSPDAIRQRRSDIFEGLGLDVPGDR